MGAEGQFSLSGKAPFSWRDIKTHTKCFHVVPALGLCPSRRINPQAAWTDMSSQLCFHVCPQFQCHHTKSRLIVNRPPPPPLPCPRSEPRSGTPVPTCDTEVGASQPSQPHSNGPRPQSPCVCPERPGRDRVDLSHRSRPLRPHPLPHPKTTAWPPHPSASPGLSRAAPSAPPTRHLPGTEEAPGGAAQGMVRGRGPGAVWRVGAGL